MSSPAVRRPRGKRIGPRGKRIGNKRPDLSTSQARFRIPTVAAGISRIVVSCHYCGYSPAKTPRGGVCPKCGKHSWERLVVPKRLLRKASM